MMLNIAQEVEEVLTAFGWDNLKIKHFFDPYDLCDTFFIYKEDKRIDTFKINHSQIEKGEVTPWKIAAAAVAAAAMTEL